MKEFLHLQNHFLVKMKKIFFLDLQEVMPLFYQHKIRFSNLLKHVFNLIYKVKRVNKQI